MNIETIRNWQFTQLQMGIDAVSNILNTADASVFTVYRDGSDGWTTLQVLGHLRDFEDVFLQRFQVMVEQDNPKLPFPDPDELATKRDYNSLSWQTLLAEWHTARETFISYLKTLSASDWERPGQHPTRGTFTPHDQLFLACWHDTLHTQQITRILQQKLK